MITDIDVSEEDKALGWSAYKTLLCDLGEGKLIGNQGIPSTRGNEYGPMLYRAPEVRKGEPYTIKSDIYSFGVILFKILKHAAEVGKSPMVPAKLLEIFERCTRENPEERPSRILDIVFELERLHDDEWLERKLVFSDFFAFAQTLHNENYTRLKDDQNESLETSWSRVDESWDTE